MQKQKKIPSPEDQRNVQMAEALLFDMKTIVSDIKCKRTNDARATNNILSAAVNGEMCKNQNAEFNSRKSLVLMSGDCLQVRESYYFFFDTENMWNKFT